MAKQRKAPKEKPMPNVLFSDFETAGMFGKIRVGSLYVRESKIYEDYTDVEKWYDRVLSLLDPDRPNIIFYHNLNFDLGKLKDELGDRLPFDLEQSLFIHHRPVRVKIADLPLIFADTLTLFGADLDSVLRDWGVSHLKINLDEEIVQLGYKSKEEYFINVPIDNPLYRKYLQHDTVGLAEAVENLYTLMNIGPAFWYTPTTPAMTTKYLKTHFPIDYKMLASTRLTKEAEEFVRLGLYGGRTEIFKPFMPPSGDGQAVGRKVDRNSMYPSEMMKEFGVGSWKWLEGGLAEMWFRKTGAKLSAVVEATVTVPEMEIPPLPMRVKGRLVFPTGRMTGVWEASELHYALSVGVKLEAINKGVFFMHTYPVFREYVTFFYKIKSDPASTKSKKAWAKLMLNALFGKTGMRRLREKIYAYSEAKVEELEEKGRPVQLMKMWGKRYILTTSYAFADYIQPHVAARVTALSRINLHQSMLAVDTHYCDTDSISYSLGREFPTEWLGETELGKWKVEREIREAVYIQPKVYAEKDIEGGEYLKIKGVPKDIRKTMTYGTFELMMEHMRRGEDYVVYKNFPTLGNLLTRLRQDRLFSDPDYINKRILAAWSQEGKRRFTKRRMDYENNITVAWDWGEVTAFFKK